MSKAAGCRFLRNRFFPRASYLAYFLSFCFMTIRRKPFSCLLHGDCTPEGGCVILRQDTRLSTVITRRTRNGTSGSKINFGFMPTLTGLLLQANNFSVYRTIFRDIEICFQLFAQWTAGGSFSVVNSARISSFWRPLATGSWEFFSLQMHG